MGHATRFDRQGAHAIGAHREGRSGQLVEKALDTVEHVVTLADAGRRREWHRALGGSGVLEVVAQRDQVDVMIGVQMADEDAVDGPRLHACAERCERALSDVQDDAGAPPPSTT